ncbi:hypothetical protein EHQ59_14230 [Leptospira kemamanensis]|uniref:Uncharacterized protein n=1 Tax=Leptospira kemamanensis TaxID=2484942 RepID=A0A4R9JQH8_9LEPT|nr:hypothetical protein [Leptospira kemamanensis]TGL49728.1 hypothetical protein EHQ59_14230 [Leptospira kemamanensis]
MRNDIATNGPNGFQMDELNFAEQNISAAQDKTQSTLDAKTKLAQNENLVRDQLKKEGFNDSDIAKKLNAMGPYGINQMGNGINKEIQTIKDKELLAKENFTEDEINGMTPEDLADRAAQIRQDQVSIFDNFADAGVALGGLLMSGGAIAFGLATGNFPNTNPNAPQNPMPPAPVATEPKPTRKEEEGEEGESIEGGETLFDASEDDTVGKELNEDSSNLVADNKDSLDQRPEFLKEIMGDYYDPRMDTDYTRPTRGEVEPLKPGEKLSPSNEIKMDR